MEKPKNFVVPSVAVRKKKKKKSKTFDLQSYTHSLHKRFGMQVCLLLQFINILGD